MRNQTLQAIVKRMTESKNYLIFSVGDSITEGFRATSDDLCYTACVARGLGERFNDRTVVR